jgi:hypothetical protein
MIYRFRGVSEPDASLAKLVDLFKRGQTEPLLLFPDASFAFVSALRQPRGDLRQALYHAGVAWRKELSYSQVLQRLYGQDGDLTAKGPSELLGDPDPTFSEAAQLVFDSLLDHLEEVG